MGGEKAIDEDRKVAIEAMEADAVAEIEAERLQMERRIQVFKEQQAQELEEYIRYQNSSFEEYKKHARPWNTLLAPLAQMPASSASRPVAAAIPAEPAAIPIPMSASVPVRAPALHEEEDLTAAMPRGMSLPPNGMFMMDDEDGMEAYDDYSDVDSAGSPDAEGAAGVDAGMEELVLDESNKIAPELALVEEEEEEEAPDMGDAAMLGRSVPINIPMRTVMPSLPPQEEHPSGSPEAEGGVDKVSATPDLSKDAEFQPPHSLVEGDAFSAREKTVSFMD